MSSNVTFITGNQSKADYLSKFIGHQIDHIKLNLDEIQSTNLKEIAEHKVRQADEQMFWQYSKSMESIIIFPRSN